mgnify:CR=1 FL=1
MDEYIKRETAIDVITDLAGKAPTRSAYEAVWKSARALRKIPATDVAPVVHGRWEFLGSNSLIKECACGTCSACKVRSKYIVNTMLCPNCGAKMDRGVDDAANGNV